MMRESLKDSEVEVDYGSMSILEVVQRHLFDFDLDFNTLESYSDLALPLGLG